jgi:hypothetical protein
MKMFWLFLVLGSSLFVASMAVAEWPRPVTTTGTVATNDVVVFADTTGKSIKKAGTNITVGATITFVGTGFTNTLTATATNFVFVINGTNTQTVP